MTDTNTAHGYRGHGGFMVLCVFGHLLWNHTMALVADESGLTPGAVRQGIPGTTDIVCLGGLQMPPHHSY